MTYRVDEEARRLHELLAKPDVLEAMRLRCEDAGDHDWVNCASPFLEIYMRCKWCGTRRR